MSQRVASLCIIAVLALALLPWTNAYSVANDTIDAQQGGWFSSIVSAVKSVVKSVVKNIVNTIGNAVRSFFSSSSPSNSGSSNPAPSSPATATRSSSSYGPSKSSTGSSYSGGSYSGGRGSSGGGSSSSGNVAPAQNLFQNILNFLNPKPQPIITAPQLGEKSVAYTDLEGPFHTNKGDTQAQNSTALPIIGITALGVAALGLSYRLGKNITDGANSVSRSFYNTSDALALIKSKIPNRDKEPNRTIYRNLDNAQFNVDLVIGMGEAANDTVRGIIELPQMIENARKSGKGFKYEFRTEHLLPAALYPISPKLSLAAAVYQADPFFIAGLGYGLGSGLWDYYTKDADEHPGRAWGRAIFDIGTFAVPASKLGSAGKLSKLGKIGKARRFNIFRDIFKTRKGEEIAKIESTLAEEKSLMKQKVPDFRPETTRYDTPPIRINKLGLPDPGTYGEAVPKGGWIWKRGRITEINYYWKPLSSLAGKWGDDVRHIVVRHELFHKALLETEGAWKMLGDIPVEARNWLMDPRNKIKIGKMSQPIDEPIVDILVAASDAKRAPMASAFSQGRWGLAPMMPKPLEPYQLTKTYIRGLEEASAKHGLPHLQKTADLLAQTMQNYMKKGHPLPAIAIGTGMPAQSR